MATTSKAGGSSPRPVHYHAHGSGGFVFSCFEQEFERHAASEYHEPIPELPAGHHLVRYTVPRPHRTTDVTRVTCRHCLIALRHVVEERLRARARGEIA